jgi:pilus assembly protein Flp/PilA
MTHITLQLKLIVRRFVRDESAATMVEYGLVVALVAIAAIVGATALGGGLNAKFNDINSKL